MGRVPLATVRSIRGHLLLESLFGELRIFVDVDEDDEAVAFQYLHDQFDGAGVEEDGAQYLLWHHVVTANLL
jgi:hypothetical protein